MRENRKEEGVFLEKSILWNVAISALKRLTHGVVDRHLEEEKAQRFSDKRRIKAPSLDQPVKHLSGGNQQKVVIAKTLAGRA